MGSYTPAFYMAGGAVIAGACIPFFLLCRKERSASRDLWTTLGPTAESADVPDWRKSVVYTVDKKASIRDPNQGLNSLKMDGMYVHFVADSVHNQLVLGVRSEIIKGTRVAAK